MSGLTFLFVWIPTIIVGFRISDQVGTTIAQAIDGQLWGNKGSWHPEADKCLCKGNPDFTVEVRRYGQFLGYVQCPNHAESEPEPEATPVEKPRRAIAAV